MTVMTLPDREDKDRMTNEGGPDPSQHIDMDIVDEPPVTVSGTKKDEYQEEEDGDYFDWWHRSKQED